MRTLTDREKRTIRFATIGVVIYLVLFGGWHVRTCLEKKRSEYLELVEKARNVKQEIQPYGDKALAVKKLMEDFRLDPAKLSQTPKASVMAQASAAIQKSAMSSGIQVGTVREDSARPSAKELATMRFEGTGPVAAVTGLLHRMESLGYPLVIDMVQVTPETTRPGQVKLSLTIVILDFEQWKSGEVPHA